MNTLCFLTLSVILVGGPAEPLSEPISLFGAIRIALKNNPELATVRARVRRAEARVQEAKSRFYPVVDLEA